MTTTPAGWYDDGHGALRWWDGSQWTQHVQNPQSAPHPGIALGEAPRKRSLWWIWLIVAAAVLVVFVVLALIVIPMAVRAIMGGAGVAGAGGDSADEKAAVATVQTYDRAWRTADCDLMISATTDDFRDDYDLTDCSVFEDQASSFVATTRDYLVTVTSVDTQDDGTVTVATTETYRSRYDENGDDTGAEKNYSDDYTYLIVPEGGSWLIDDSE